MSVMPPSPFLEFPSSPEPIQAPHNNGERLPSSDAAGGPGEALARSSEVEPAAHNGLVADSIPAAPTSFVLDEDRFMAEIEEPPAFITVPSQGYLLACEREQTEAIIEFLTK